MYVAENLLQHSRERRRLVLHSHRKPCTDQTYSHARDQIMAHLRTIVLRRLWETPYMQQ